MSVLSQGETTSAAFMVGYVSSSKILEKIHMDVWGHAPTASIGGMKYFATWIDGASRFVKVSISHTKGEVFERLRHYTPNLRDLRIRDRIFAVR